MAKNAEFSRKIHNEQNGVFVNDVIRILSQLEIAKKSMFYTRNLVRLQGFVK